MNRPITVVQYWAGCPKSPDSKWQSFLAIVERCRKEGWKSYLVWSRMPENSALREPFRDAGCEIVLQPRSRGNFDPVSIWRTYALCRHLRCDVFHCYNDHTSPLIGGALARVPVRIWSKLAMSSQYEKGSSQKGWHCLVPSTRVSCLCAHRVLAISNKVASELKETVGFHKKIETVYVPVDYDRFAHAVKGGIRHELGFSGSHILITSVGHAVPVKGWDVAVKAFVRVHQRVPSARLVLVGDKTSSEHYLQLVGLVKQYGMEEEIRFTGKRDDIPEILKASDVFMFPSRSEGLGLAQIEAMAAALPSVAARTGGIPELVRHGDTGLLFEAGNVEELASHVVKLIEDQSFRARIASQASIRARMFNMTAYADRVFGCYTSLLGRVPTCSVENSA